MGESVEQAALRRATQEPVTDPRVVSALQSLSKIIESDGRTHKLLAARIDGADDEIARLHEENAELRDAILALSNRIEAVNRDHRTLHGAYTAHISAPHVA